MPKTKFQEIIFALLMSLAMAFGMEHYNLGIGHGGFDMWMFKAAWHWKDIPLMTVIVFIMEHFIAGPIARKRAFKLVTPGKDTLVTPPCLPLSCCWPFIQIPSPLSCLPYWPVMVSADSSPHYSPWPYTLLLPRVAAPLIPPSFVLMILELV